ncbi:hypothetical protein GCM10009114_19240 [Aliiglaciecola litoralis]|uniref:Uncharacterized protein n=1 Tax=Aliiglaciecola litoralis TaxID=582857 RepID=A0ABN1LIV4_9ALTE
MVLTKEEFIEMLRKCFEENYYICPFSRMILPKAEQAHARPKQPNTRVSEAISRINN